jgi:hypothetical protein
MISGGGLLLGYKIKTSGVPPVCSNIGDGLLDGLKRRQNQLENLFGYYREIQIPIDF